MMDDICKLCEYWMNTQRTLNYLENWGICEADLMYDWDKPKSIKIRVENLHDGDFVDSDGTLSSHKFLFCTHEDFGCKVFKKRE